MGQIEINTGNPSAIDIRKINRVVAVMTTVRAGTSLISSLLDAHPNVLSTPDCVLMYITKFWDEYGHLPAEQMIDKFTDQYAVLFDANDASLSSDVSDNIGADLNFTRMGANRDESLYVDRTKFKEIFLATLPEGKNLDRKLLFQAVHYAYTAAWGHQTTDPLISFGLHIAHDTSVATMLEDFPDTHFLQMVRHPVLGLASHFRMHTRQGQVEPQSAVGTMNMARYMGAPNPEENRDRWRAIRLEDLHSQPRDILQRMCDWLELPWDDSLLDSTQNGMKWWNEKNSIQLSGMNSMIPSQQFKEFLPAFDRFRLDVLFAPKCDAWDYPVKSIHRNLAVKLMVLPLLAFPLKMELLSIFSKTTSPRGLGFFSQLSERWTAYYRGRRFMVGAWLRTFKDSRTEVALL